MPDLDDARDLLGEWRKAMESLVSSIGGRAELPRQIAEPLQRQLELVQEVIERERRVQRQVAGLLVAPVDSVFNLLEESALMLRRQAEALDAAGRALEDTAGMVKRQAELFDQTIGVLREPSEVAKSLAGLERRPRKTGRAKSGDGKSEGRGKSDGRRKSEGRGKS